MKCYNSSLVWCCSPVDGELVDCCWVTVAVLEAVVLSSAVAELAHPRLKDKGLHVSRSGVSVKTDKTANYEGYLDATQRSGFYLLPLHPHRGR